MKRSSPEWKPGCDRRRKRFVRCWIWPHWTFLKRKRLAEKDNWDCEFD